MPRSPSEDKCINVHTCRVGIPISHARFTQTEPNSRVVRSSIQFDTATQQRCLQFYKIGPSLSKRLREIYLIGHPTVGCLRLAISTASLTPWGVLMGLPMWNPHGETSDNCIELRHVPVQMSSQIYIYIYIHIYISIGGRGRGKGERRKEEKEAVYICALGANNLSF